MAEKKTPTRANSVATTTTRPVSALVSAPVVCPKCWVQTNRMLNSESGGYNFTCPNCKTEFSCSEVTIRAKNSHYAHNQQWREFSVRVILPGNVEREIAFVNYLSSADLELRSRDKALFTLFENEWYVVHNLTINKFLLLKKYRAPRQHWSLRTLLLFFLILIIGVGLAYLVYLHS